MSRKCSNKFAQPLTNLINSCLTEGFFPDLFKSARYAICIKMKIKQNRKTFDKFTYCQVSQKYLR